MKADLYEDIERFLKLSDTELEYVLAAWSVYRSADGGLVDLLVDHVQDLRSGACRDMKESYFQAMLKKAPWVSDYLHHVKAITLASCKHNDVSHPDLVRSLLEANKHITLPVLLDTIEEHKTEERWMH